MDRLTVLFIWTAPFLLGFLTLAVAPVGPSCSLHVLKCDTKMHLLGGIFPLSLGVEERLLLFTALVGALGGAADIILSNPRPAPRVTVARWALRVISQIAVGAITGLLSYQVIRTAAFAPDASVEAVNVIGVGALCLMAGFASRSVVRWLESILAEQLGAAPAQTDFASAMESIDHRVRAVLAQPVLDNWRGQVGLEIGPWETVYSDEVGALQRSAGLIVHFAPQSRLPSRMRCQDLIVIERGQNSENVVFEIVADSAEVDLRPIRTSCIVPATGELVSREVIRLTAGRQEGSAKLVLSILQKGVLVQSLVTSIPLSGSETAAETLDRTPG